MKKDLEKDLANSEKYDPKGGWWPFVNQQQDRQHQIIFMLADNIGIGEQVSELKAQYRVLEGKVDTDNSLVERKVIINKEMKEKVLKAMNSRDTVDEKGKLQIANLAHDNEVLILNNDAIMIKMMAEMMAVRMPNLWKPCKLRIMTRTRACIMPIACTSKSPLST